MQYRMIRFANGGLERMWKWSWPTSGIGSSSEFAWETE